MPLATYANLLTMMQSYEDDTSTIVTDIQADMVTLAEQRIFFGSGVPSDQFYTPALRCRAMEKMAVIPIGAGLDGGTVGGTANAITLDMDTTPTLTAGLIITFTATATNTGATTVNPEALGVKDIKKGKSLDALEAGDILNGGTYSIYYDGTQFVLMPSDGSAPLPASFLGVKSAYLQDRDVILTFEAQMGVNTYMDNVNGQPSYYTIEGDCIRIDPLPDGDYKLALVYYRKPAALSTALNDIFRDAPGIYLYAALFEMALYLESDERAIKYFKQFKSALEGYGNSEVRASTTYGVTRARFREAH